MDKVNDLVVSRAAAYDAFAAIAAKAILNDAEKADYPKRKQAVLDLDDQIKRAREAQALAAASAKPVDGQPSASVPATVEADPFLSEDAAKARHLTTKRGLVVGGMVRMIARANQMSLNPKDVAHQLYGESHPITRALERAMLAATGATGGFIVPPDYLNEIIDLLYAATVIRSSGPRVIPMPRGTMTIPGLATSASAAYGAEGVTITSSQASLRDINASFKKLTALVPVSNDLMRYADPAADAMVRDNLVEVMAIVEDTAFIFGDGSAAQPMGILAFANQWVLNQGGTAGSWFMTGNSTGAVDNAGFTGDPRFGNNGGNFITSNETYTLATAAAELGGMVQKLDAANLKSRNRIWLMNPRAKNYLFNVQNSLGNYVYRDEMSKGTLLMYPFKDTTEIGTAYHDPTSTNDDCSFLFLLDMNEVMIFDSMSLELAVSREGTYVDGGGTMRSAFGQDLTLVRAIQEHDLQMRHTSGVAVNQFNRWAPAIS